MSDSIGAVILAAGAGTRLNFNIPKPLIPLLGKALIDYPVEAAKSFLGHKYKESIGVVIGHEKESMEAHLSRSPVMISVQENLDGTGGAIRSYFKQTPWAEKKKYTVVMCCDTPLISAEILATLYTRLKEAKAKAIVASFIVDDPHGYGRIVRGEKGFAIREESDATDELRKIKEVNSGLYIVETKYLLESLDSLTTKNEANEFYLTDLFKEGENVVAKAFENPDLFRGINTMSQLEDAEKIMRTNIIQRHLDNGVRFIDRLSTYIDGEVIIGAGTTLYPNVFLIGKTRIGKENTIEPGVFMENSSTGDNVKILANCHINETMIGPNSSIGPMARLREGSYFEGENKIGNFVETKKMVFKKGAQASHLSYIGDAEIGENTNLGCGFITCNYDGANKNKTEIGRDCFIGSDSQMIAPLKIGDAAYIASGSTITKDVPAGAFAIARGRQETKEGLAKKFIKKKQ